MPKPLPKLDLNITNRCNFRCIHCCFNSGETTLPEFSLNKIKEIGLLDYIYDKCMPDAIILFGSASKGEDTEESDIDIFVRFREGATLFDYVALAQELEGLLQVRVDLVSEGGIRKELKDRIAKEVLMA